MDLNILMWGALAIVLAASTQALAGFGFVMMAAPFLIIIFDPKTAVGLTLILSFSSVIVLLYSFKKDVNWQLVKQLLKGSLIGLPLGLIVFYTITVDTLKALVSIAIVVISLLNLTNYEVNLDKSQEKWKVIVGGISGFLSGSVGMSGPPVILLMNNLDMKKEEFRATILGYFAIMHPASFVPMILMGAIPLENIRYAIVLAPFILVGMFIGRQLFKKVSEELFKKIVLVLLILVATYSFIRSFI
ncbi:MAG: hypothetical protein APF76_11625 [Desulfitibacter sp. BRH_c19]|nr:MAG: hypothetical protein APF76_11625 [Desulfitibacter sp. BRH_c19]